jgi:hypothetical protein
LSFTVTAQRVTVNNNVLKFGSIADYEAYANGEEDEADLIGLAQSNASFTSKNEQNPNDTLIRVLCRMF